MGEIKLNRKLNLVQTVETDTGKVYVHSVPISLAVFKDNYLPIAMTYTELYARRLVATGFKIAKNMLVDKSKEAEIEQHVQQALLTEIQRLTHVIVLNSTGWETIPYREAINRKLLDEWSADEVENVIVYFTCVSSMGMRTELAVIMENLPVAWGLQTSSLNVTEYMHSLQTSTQSDNIGENVTQLPEKRVSSIPG